jgi:hypothetical protein
VAATIRLLSAEAHDLPALAAWLNDEDALRGRITRRRAAPGPEEMGSLHDALLIAVGSGGAISVLASSLPAWLQQRKSAVRIEISHDEHGRKAVIDATNIGDAERLIASVLET